MSIQISFAEKSLKLKSEKHTDKIWFKEQTIRLFKHKMLLDCWYKDAKEEFIKEHPEYKKYMCANEKVKSTKWLTFRPVDDTTIEQLWYGTQEWINRRWIKEFKMVFEQKGETEDELGKGKHIHVIYTHTQKSQGEMIDEIQRDYKKYGVVFGGNQPKISPIKTAGDLERLHNYIKEYKEDDELKKKAFALDGVWRDTVGLRRFYDIAPLPTPKGLIVSPYNQVHDGTNKIIDLMNKES